MTQRRLSRQTLAKFLPDHESIVAFENLIAQVAEVLPDAAADGATARAIQEAASRASQSEVSALRAEVARLRAMMEQGSRDATISKLQREVNELRALVIGA